MVNSKTVKIELPYVEVVDQFIRFILQKKSVIWKQTDLISWDSPWVTLTFSFCSFFCIWFFTYSLLFLQFLCSFILCIFLIFFTTVLFCFFCCRFIPKCPVTMSRPAPTPHHTTHHTKSSSFVFQNCVKNAVAAVKIDF